jgi:hypothetical protein
MTRGGKRTGTVGYNVQAAVDTKHHLIVEHVVTKVGSDPGQLSRMAMAARKVIGKPGLKVLADRSARAKWSASQRISRIYSPQHQGEGLFTKRDFIYTSKSNGNQGITRRGTAVHEIARQTSLSRNTVRCYLRNE